METQSLLTQKASDLCYVTFDLGHNQAPTHLSNSIDMPSCKVSLSFLVCANTILYHLAPSAAYSLLLVT